MLLERSRASPPGDFGGMFPEMALYVRKDNLKGEVWSGTKRVGKKGGAREE